MNAHPTPNFHNLPSYQCLSTKKERKSCFTNFAPPPKAPIRSCPVPRIHSIFKETLPRPVSFRENPDSSFISGSPLYKPNKNKGTYFEQCYYVEKVLGRGSFGEVFKVISKESGLTYACKRTLLKYRGELDRERRIEEVKKHEQLPPHNNCVRFFRAWEEENQLYLLTEVCQYSLADLIANNDEFNETRLWSFLIDILQGLRHLHENKLIHMDVKSDNIFIGEDGVCKLGDFGLVIDFSNGYPSEAVEGDPKYLAPECLQNVYSPAADIFSLGIVMLEVATDLFLPQTGPLWHQLRSGNLPTLDWRGLSPEFEWIVRCFLDPNPANRMTSSDSLNAPIVRSIRRKRSISRFFKKKVDALKCCINSIMVWPLFIFSMMISVFKYQFGIVSKEKKFSFDQIDAGRETVDHGELISDLSVHGNEESTPFSLMNPIINSTPISHCKRRQAQPISLRFNGDDDIPDGKFSFNESSFITLEASNEEVSSRALNLSQKCNADLDLDLSNPSNRNSNLDLSNPSERHSNLESSPTTSKGDFKSHNVTTRNLLDLFNTAEFSEDDGSWQKRVHH